MNATDLSAFLTWFEERNMFPVKHASDEQIVNAIQQYSAEDADLEFDLREEMFGPGAYAGD